MADRTMCVRFAREFKREDSRHIRSRKGGSRIKVIPVSRFQRKDINARCRDIDVMTPGGPGIEVAVLIYSGHANHSGIGGGI
jgi:hypothetical protein